MPSPSQAPCRIQGSGRAWHEGRSRRKCKGDHEAVFVGPNQIESAKPMAAQQRWVKVLRDEAETSQSTHRFRLPNHP
jgi:hypothetical protein